MTTLEEHIKSMNTMQLAMFLDNWETFRSKTCCYMCKRLKEEWKYCEEEGKCLIEEGTKTDITMEILTCIGKED